MGVVVVLPQQKASELALEAVEIQARLRCRHIPGAFYKFRGPTKALTPARMLGAYPRYPTAKT
jgi:hypothetical protein